MRIKKLLLWASVLVFSIFAATVVMAQETMALDADSGQRVYDMAGLMDEDETEELEEEIAEYRKKFDFDIVVVTTEDAEGKGSQDYADVTYEKYGFGVGSDKDGILFLIDMDNRELAVSTSGKAIRIFTDERIERILDDVYESAEEGDYAASAEAFLEDVKEFGEQGIPSDQYNYDTETGKVSRHKSIRWYEALIAIVVSAFAGGTACQSVKRSYAMEDDPEQIRNLNMAYRANCQFAIADPIDNMVNQVVTTRIVPRNTQKSSGGAGGSFSGQSSTHTSSGGGTHGGGSRKF